MTSVLSLGNTQNTAYFSKHGINGVSRGDARYICMDLKDMLNKRKSEPAIKALWDEMYKTMPKIERPRGSPPVTSISVTDVRMVPNGYAVGCQISYGSERKFVSDMFYPGSGKWQPAESTRVVLFLPENIPTSAAP